MITQTEAQIYLGSLRGCTESIGIRSLHTFNFQKYHRPSAEPFGKLLVWNEETLAAEKRLKLETKRPTDIFILPLAGGIELMDGQGDSVFISPGESFNFLSFPESAFELINPYPNQIISFLQIHTQPDFPEMSSDFEENEALISFSLEEKNQLTSAFSSASQTISGWIGKYGGREEDIYNLNNSDNGVFVFIIEGAFEVANRLLEKGDALSLRHVDEVEFEALSNNAIILLVELKI